MPNYDLGTAHGRIKIDVDDKGAITADKDLSKLEASMAKLKAQGEKLQGSLSKVEAELDRLASNFRKADSSATSYQRSTDKVDTAQKRASGSSRNLSRDLSDLIRKFHEAAEAADTFAPALSALSRVAAAFKSNEKGGLGGFLASARKAGLASIGISALSNAFLGVGKATRDLPRWQKNLLTLANTSLLIGSGAKFINRFVKATTPLSAAAAFVGREFGKTGKQAQGFFDVMSKLPRGTANLVTGLAVARNGLGGLSKAFGPIIKAPILIKAAFAGAVAGTGALVQASAKALPVISNAFALTLNAATQLSGAVLAVPGIFLTAGLAGASLALVFKGLSKSFKDVFSDDPKKAAKAWAKLPEQLKPVATAIKDVLPKFKEMQSLLQTSALQGSGDDIKSLGDTYLPLVQKGALGVINSFRGAKDQIVAFAKSKETVQGIGAGFFYTSQTVNHLSDALIPLVAGLRDIAVVGTQFISDLTAGASGLTDKFAAWAALNKSNGNLFKWMTDGVQGAKDLLKGILSLTKALWSLLTLFQTDSGDNALERFAASMEKFNAAVDKSKAGGELKKISDAVKSLGTDKIDNLLDIGRSLKSTFNSILPVVLQVSKSFGTVFVPAVKLALLVIKGFFEAIQSSGLAPLIGTLAGLAAGFALIWKVVAPLRSLIQVFAGIGIAVKGANALIQSFGGGISFLTGSASKGARAVSILSGAFKALGIASAAAIIGFAAYSSYTADLQAGDAQLKKNAEDAKAFGQSLKDAFVADKATTGKNVFDTVDAQMSTMLSNLQSTADAAPTLMDHITGFFDFSKQHDEKTTWNPLQGIGDPKQLNQLQAAAAEAAKAKGAFDRLGLTSKDLAGIVSGSSAIFDQFKEALSKSGDGGTEAAAQLDQYRQKFVQIQKDFQEIGPGGVELAAGIKQIAEAGGDATSKLEGLKAALQGLGLLQTSAIETAFAYAQAVREIGEKAASAVDSTQPLNDILDATGKGFNYASVNGQNLFGVLSGVADKFLASASATGDASGEYAKLAPQLQGVADAFQLPLPAIQNLLSQLGVVPNVVDILVQVSGKDKAAQDIAAVTAAITANAGKGVDIPVQLDNPKKVADLIWATIGSGAVKDVTDNGLVLAPNLDPSKLAKAAAAAGIQLPGGPAPTAGDQATMPVAPTVQPGPPTSPIGTPPPATTTGPTLAPGVPVAAPQAPPVDTKALDDANAKVTELQGQIATLNANPPKVDPSQLTAVNGVIDATIAKFQQFQQAIATSMQGAMASIASFVSQANSAITSAGAANYAAGLAFGNNFANGIAATAPQVAKAAAGLAATARAFMPGSPAKKGPLSGDGWSGIAGQHFSADFAGGIGSGQGAVSKSAASVAGSAGSALKGPFDIQGILGKASQLSQFFQHAFDLFQNVSDIFFKAAKFASDPLGEGTFFGQRPKYVQSVSDKELQKKKEDDLQNKLSDALDSGEKKQSDAVQTADNNPTKYQTDANGNAVLDANGKPIPIKKAGSGKTGTGTKGKATPTVPLTADQKQLDLTAPENAPPAGPPVDLNAKLTTDELQKISQNTGITASSQNDIIRQLRSNDSNLDSAIRTAKDPNSSSADTSAALAVIDAESQKQKKTDTPASRGTSSALDSITSTAASDKGLTQQENPVDTTSNIAGGAFGVVGDAFKVIDGVINSIGAVSNISDTLVRGISNTEDIYNMVDQVQKFLDLAVSIGQTVTDGLSLASTIASAAGSAGGPIGGGAAGGLAAASTAASLITSAISAVNAGIDLAQEAYRIFGSYFGEFLGFLTGSGTKLEGDVKFLLDTTTNTVKAYSADNPQLKYDHALPFSSAKTPAPKVGDINVFPARGDDPAAISQRMMFAVKTAGMGSGAKQ